MSNLKEQGEQIRKLGEQTTDLISKMFDNLEDRIDEKSAALDKFGQHLGSCPLAISPKFRVIGARCTCGFDAAKEA